MKKLNLNENGNVSDYFSSNNKGFEKDAKINECRNSLNYQSAPISFRERRRIVLLHKDAKRNEILAQQSHQEVSSKDSARYKQKKLSQQFGPSSNALRSHPIKILGYGSYFNSSRNSKQNIEYSLDLKNEEFQNISALLYQKKSESREASSNANKIRVSQEQRMPPRNNSFRHLTKESHSQKSLNQIPALENSMKTNKEEILNSISLNGKENKSALQQKLNILGKILSKGKDVGQNRKKSESGNFSNYSCLFYQNTSHNNISKDGVKLEFL